MPYQTASTLITPCRRRNPARNTKLETDTLFRRETKGLGLPLVEKPLSRRGNYSPAVRSEVNDQAQVGEETQDPVEQQCPDGMHQLVPPRMSSPACKATLTSSSTVASTIT